MSFFKVVWGSPKDSPGVQTDDASILGNSKIGGVSPLRNKSEGLSTKKPVPNAKGQRPEVKYDK